MSTPVADFNVYDFNLTGASVSPVTDAYNNTWTLYGLTYGVESLTNYGSVLQNTPPTGDLFDDSALKGDAYVIAPAAAAGEVVESFFEARVFDYNQVGLRWSIGQALSEGYGEAPVPTEIMIRFDTVGEPQTVSNGVLVTRITSQNQVSAMVHEPVPEGAWLYYSLFVRYSSTAVRHWWEKVADLHIQTPSRLGSTDLLWSKVPNHYQIQDGADSATVPTTSELFARGPLYRLLNLIGFDLDRLRTLINHQMLSKDPALATPEVLDALSYELGLPMTSVDLGTERIRSIISDIGYLRGARGTFDGVREWITAITGCDVTIDSVLSNVLSSTQSTFSSGLSLGASAPASSDWVVETDSASYELTSDGLRLYASGLTDYTLVALKTLINVDQCSGFTGSYDAVNLSDGFISGISITSSTQDLSTVSISSTGEIISSIPGFVFTESSRTEDEYEVPVDFGLVGDGTFTTAPMYLYVYVMLGPGTSEVTVNNINVYSKNRYPYNINIYSQRANLLRDPRFINGIGSSSYWSVTPSSGTVTVFNSAGTLSASAGTSASVMFTTNASVGPGLVPIPVRLGIPYYLSVLDMNDNIVEARLYSTKYGLLSSSTEVLNPIVYGSGEVRKVWKLERPYQPPWIPRDIEDCFIELVSIVSAGETAALRDPLFEYLNSSGEYFDGNNINGGWLAGPTASSGVADYRWGDDGVNVSCSYFTSDYQRTVATIYRLIGLVLPVTESIDATQVLKFNRLYGYSGNDQP